MVNAWRQKAGLEGEFSSYSLRKTFGCMMRTNHEVDVTLIQELYEHASSRQTLAYVGTGAEELAAVYVLGVG